MNDPKDSRKPPDDELRDVHDRMDALKRTVEQLEAAMEALRQSEAGYRALWEAVPDPIFRCTRGGIIVGFKPAPQFRLFAPVDEFLGKPFRDVLPATTAELIQRAIDYAFATRQMQVIEYRLPFEGASRDYEGRMVVCSEDEVLVIVRDITARKQTEEAQHKAHEILEERVRERTAELTKLVAQLEQEMAERKRIESALRASEEQFRAEYKAIPVPTYTWRKTGDEFTLVDFNDAALRITRGKARDILGKTAREVHSGRPDIIEHLRRCFEQRTMLREEMPYHYTTTGEDRHLIVTYAHVPPDLVMVHTVDITERVEAEQAFRREEELLRQMLAVQDRDRKLLAYEIHDGLSQHLTGALLLLQGFRDLVAKDPKEAWRAFEAGLRSLSQGVSESRRLIGGLRPPVLDKSGVVAAVENLVLEARQRGGPKIEFASDVRFDRLEPTLENAIFRIVQECLTNACRHSKSERVLVRLAQRGDRIRVEIRDWGVGFDPGTVRGLHFGLQGIRERARLLSGEAVIRSSPGQGSQILVDLPLIESAFDRPSPDDSGEQAAPVGHA